MVTEIQREVSKMACMTGKTTNSTAKNINENNQETGELRTMVLQNRESCCRLSDAQAQSGLSAISWKVLL